MENHGLQEQCCFPQIKVCGLTSPEAAAQCALLGADAIGVVFFPKSPRCVTIDQAKAICAGIPSHTARVGVFVDESYDRIMKIVASCGLSAVQLHGHEPPTLVSDLRRQNLIVIKALYMESEPSVKQAARYEALAFLVECARGVLPGGNAMGWNWKNARPFGKKHPLILAGGLNPENIAQAVIEAQPDAVDVSSGVESSPGKKDIHKIKAFIHAVQGCTPDRKPRRIF
jgi:phosphoribosylanthranilate isomerase